MKLSRTKFKHAVRKCKKDKETIIADSIAEKMCQKDPRKFWKNFKHRVNSKTKIPTNVDGLHGDDNIGSMWKCGSITTNVDTDDNIGSSTVYMAMTT